MKQNHLYKCTNCGTVKAIDENFGKSTWALSCRACGQIVTEHYRLDIMDHITFSSEEFPDGNWNVGCPKEKEDNDIKNDSK